MSAYGFDWMGYNKMVNERNAAVQEHPLLAALKDTQRMAAMNRAIKGIAKAQHGIQKRREWMDIRQQQVDHLEVQVKLILEAFDNADQRGMIEALREIDRTVTAKEGQSPLQETLSEVLDIEEDADTRTVEEVQKVFRGRRRDSSGGVYNG